jgi:hypothetical protein
MTITNNILFYKEDTKVQNFDLKKLRSINEYIELFKEFLNAKSTSLNYKIIIITDFCNKLIKKSELLKESLLSQLTPKELTYIKIISILNNIDVSVRKNLNNILFRLRTFDEEEYLQSLRSQSSNISTERRQIYKDYIEYINLSIDFLDRIILQIDKLQHETAKLSTIDVSQVDNLSVVQDIDSLINSMKLYKN